MTMAFGIRVKTLRKQKGLSQLQLGRMVGVHYNQIGLYERGGAMPSINVLSRLAHALGTTTDALLREPEPPAPEPSRHLSVAPTNDDETAPTNRDENPLDARLTELVNAARELNETDRRTVVALLEAFVLKSRVAAMVIDP